MVMNNGSGRIRSGGRVVFDMGGNGREEMFDISIGRHGSKTTFEGKERNGEK